MCVLETEAHEGCGKSQPPTQTNCACASDDHADPVSQAENARIPPLRKRSGDDAGGQWFVCLARYQRFGRYSRLLNGRLARYAPDAECSF